ncbi:MAG TPA: transcription antitermination factor NusB [Chloroflexia bacterium]|nr:transcription antitermination factor NusB [Chloroflexia bacterium]
MASPSRRQARIIALQALYEADTTNHPIDDVLRRHLDEPFSEQSEVEEDLQPEVRAFARALVEGVRANSEELDSIVAKSAPNWPVDQMSRIDKNILKVAIFEILFDNKVPLKAAINEAVELAKRFGSDSSSRFINGVLGSVAADQQARGRKASGKNPSAK